MPSFDQLSFSSGEFTGKVRIFPLPNLVLFPHVMQPLHIFEPRYRALMEDALAGDRMIAMALLKPGWEPDYDGRPPLYPMACLGQVASFNRLADDTYNLLLLGVKRVRLVGELDPARSYREGKGLLCEDVYPQGSDSQDSSVQGRMLQQALRDAFLRSLPKLPEAYEQIEQFMASDVALGVLTDLISFMLDIDIAHKEALLSEVNVFRRAEILLKYLAARVTSRIGGSPSGFPNFSAN
jgi:Lon protease-like protein